VALWHRAIEPVAADFRFELGYLVTGWTGWALIGLGLILLVPVVATIGRKRDGRFYRAAATPTWVGCRSI
jgi:hypothetical protein